MTAACVGYAILAALGIFFGVPIYNFLTGELGLSSFFAILIIFGGAYGIFWALPHMFPGFVDTNKYDD